MGGDRTFRNRGEQANVIPFFSRGGLGEMDEFTTQLSYKNFVWFDIRTLYLNFYTS